MCEAFLGMMALVSTAGMEDAILAWTYALQVWWIIHLLTRGALKHVHRKRQKGRKNMLTAKHGCMQSNTQCKYKFKV